ncbi:MAG: peptidylprolyl isomerase, partial [Pseudomonadales bacterium]
VKMTTSLGSLVIVLDDDQAPATVANFLSYVDDGSYANTIFHRVIPNFMAQGGGFYPGLQMVPTREPVVNEAKSSGLQNNRGTIAMARTNNPDSATRQFYINLKDNAFLDPNPNSPGYAVFGRVESGMDVVDLMATKPTSAKSQHQNVPLEPIVIIGVERMESVKYMRE